LLLRHVPFLKAVFWHSLTAFGGPHGHYGMMLRTFVNERKDITNDELLDYNAFTQILPGAGSTQILTLIGYKRGGVLLATLTLIIWILPACVLMSALSFLFQYYSSKQMETPLFQLLKPMAIGFLLFAAVQFFTIGVKNLITVIIMAISVVLTLVFFKSPWIFPAVLLAGGIATNFSSKRIPQQAVKPRKIKWNNIWLWALIFVLAGVCSELARTHNWPNRKAFNLFENTYRHGSLVFGGGNILIPYMYEQYVIRPKYKKNSEDIIKIAEDDFLKGAGMVRAIPGPVFSIASFTGGMALKDKGVGWQLLGCLIGSLAIFLPSALFVLFFFPIWNNLKKYAIVYRAIEGINAAVVGILIASVIYIFKESELTLNWRSGSINITVLLVTFAALKFTKIPAPIIVIIVLALGRALELVYPNF
jgi:chromate transporter